MSSEQDEVSRLRDEVTRLKLALSDAERQLDLAHSMYRVTVAQRNIAWHELDQARDALRRLADVQR
ncbi:MAG: hypothetical protein RIS35_2470 [Pseudomonadota bacterium]|jgi:hypothetical protein